MKKIIPILLILLIQTGCVNITLEQAKKILKEKNIELNKKNLFTFQETKDAETLELFLQAGMNPNTKDRFERTAITRELNSNNPKLNLIKLYSKYGYDFNFSDNYNPPPLCLAVSFFNTPINYYTGIAEPVSEEKLAIFQYLLNLGDIDINQKDSFGNTPLSYGISSWNTKIVETFLNNGANPNIINLYGKSPLYDLIEWNNGEKEYLNSHFKTAKLLLDKGADPNIEHGEDKVERHSCVVGIPKAKYIVNQAILAGQPLKLIKLLVDSGADLNKREEGNYTSLMISLFENEKVNLDVIQYLIDKGVPINETNKYGETCLDHAIGEIKSFENKKKELSEYQPYAVEWELNWANREIKIYTKVMNLLRKHGAKTGSEIKKEKSNN